MSICLNHNLQAIVAKLDFLLFETFSFALLFFCFVCFRNRVSQLIACSSELSNVHLVTFPSIISPNEYNFVCDNFCLKQYLGYYIQTSDLSETPLFMFWICFLVFCVSLFSNSKANSCRCYFFVTNTNLEKIKIKKSCPEIRFFRSVLFFQWNFHSIYS